jgi:glycosyltransferase involved in cell wall biosynthesis
VRLSVVVITYNEEANIRRTLESVLPLVSDDAGEIVVVDSGSTDRTVDIARELGAKVWVEPWKGFAAQKNSAIDKATGEWVLSLDADESLDANLSRCIDLTLRWRGGEDLSAEDADWLHDRVSLDAEHCNAFSMARNNYFLGRWMRHGGFRERKVRLFLRNAGRFKDVPVHEVVEVTGAVGHINDGALEHHQYPTLDSYIEHMNRYSSLGAEIAMSKGHRSFSFVNIVIRPQLTFFQKYFLKLGFLDGREGLLLCLYHSVYVSWKYAKAWERARKPRPHEQT